MKFVKITGLVAILLPALGFADVVVIGGVDYKIKHESTSEKSIEMHERFAKKMSPFFYTIKYMDMFENESASNSDVSVKKEGLDNHQKALAVQGTVLGLGMANGLGVNGFDISGLAVNFFFSGVEDAAVKVAGTDIYRLVVDGSVTIGKWITNKEPLDALADEYVTLKSVIASHCGFSEIPKEKIGTGTDWASIQGKCKETGEWKGLGVRKVKYYPSWSDAHGDGLVFEYSFSAKKRSPEQMRELAARLRSTLGDGWYVMQADTLTNQATGAAEKVYLISKNGVMKAYPLPPEPVFQ